MELEHRRPSFQLLGSTRVKACRHAVRDDSHVPRMFCLPISWLRQKIYAIGRIFFRKYVPEHSRIVSETSRQCLRYILIEAKGEPISGSSSERRQSGHCFRRNSLCPVHRVSGSANYFFPSLRRWSNEISRQKICTSRKHRYHIVYDRCCVCSSGKRCSDKRFSKSAGFRQAACLVALDRRQCH